MKEKPKIKVVEENVQKSMLLWVLGSFVFSLVSGNDSKQSFAKEVLLKSNSAANDIKSVKENAEALGVVNESFSNLANFAGIVAVTSNAAANLLSFANTTMIPFLRSIDYNTVLSNTVTWALNNPWPALFVFACSTAVLFYVAKEAYAYYGSVAEKGSEAIITNVETVSKEEIKNQGDEKSLAGVQGVGAGV